MVGLTQLYLTWLAKYMSAAIRVRRWARVDEQSALQRQVEGSARDVKPDLHEMHASPRACRGGDVLRLGRTLRLEDRFDRLGGCARSRFAGDHDAGAVAVSVVEKELHPGEFVKANRRGAVVSNFEGAMEV